jgi:hypothetical protein
MKLDRETIEDLIYKSVVIKSEREEGKKSERKAENNSDVVYSYSDDDVES